jgi:AcrR family transcriptional regulator
MPTDSTSLRADARRNRERILAAAGELFALRGPAVPMEEIAAHAGVGVGTLYRRFPTKDALLTAMVRARFEAFIAIAREAADAIADPLEALTTLLRRHLEQTEGDTGFQLAVMGSNALQWEGVDQQRAELSAANRRVVDRAVAAGVVRADLTPDDLPMLLCGVTSTMYFQPGFAPDWRRHLEIVLDGLRPR